MKTRRSWRNQNRLWKYLGGPAPPPIAHDAITAAEAALKIPTLNRRTRRMFERDLARAKHRAAVRLALNMAGATEGESK